jgi:hypothetical protein
LAMAVAWVSALVLALGWESALGSVLVSALA